LSGKCQSVWRLVTLQWIFWCIGRVASWHFKIPSESNLAFLGNLAVKKLLLQFGTFWHSLFFEFGSYIQFWHLFAINLAVTNDFIIDGIVEKLAFFSLSHQALTIIINYHCRHHRGVERCLNNKHYFWDHDTVSTA